MEHNAMQTLHHSKTTQALQQSTVNQTPTLQFFVSYRTSPVRSCDEVSYKQGFTISTEQNPV